MARKPLARQVTGNAPPAELLAAFGGVEKCRELSTALYARVGSDPALRHLFPGKTHKCAIEEFSAFLAQFLGGSSEDTQRRWWLSLRESHGRFQIGQTERDAWIEHMRKALEDVAMSEPMRSALRDLFEEASVYVVNTGKAVGAVNCPAEHSDIHAQISHRWEAQLAVDEAVAAVRKGELHRIITMVGSTPLQTCFERNRPVFANFVGVLIGSGNISMAEYALKVLLENPDLAQEKYSGRTLLHAAAAAGNLLIVEALLERGVDANISDAGGHTPLYSVGNECSGGAAVVKALIRGGAKVDACGGVKRCTALHMAARRDYVEVSEALVACGANIEARDSLGETPLRRAINCGQTGVAALLLAKGADPHAVGSKGLTPMSAARAGAMRSLLRSWTAT